jgi:lantibiotic modifying enzyme
MALVSLLSEIDGPGPSAGSGAQLPGGPAGAPAVLRHADPPGSGLRARFLAHAATLAERLVEHAVEAPGGGIGWQVHGGTDGERPPVGVGPHLYEGVTGVALFLASLDHVRGRDDHRELVLRAVAPLRRALRELVRDPARAGRMRLQVGGLVGLGAFLYSFTRLGEWLREPALVGEAHDLTLLFTPERVRADARLDVVDGCAGAVLALLALDAAAPEANSAGAAPLDLASACAAHLLERRTSHEGRPRAWAASGKPPLTGFAHGATGAACALLRLFARTGDEALRDAALEGFAFEHSLFDPAADNWLDLRSGRLLEQSAWCHGAPGAALGRSGVIEIHGGPGAREELAGLLRSTRALPDAPVDHLCCGNLGRADILLAAHQALGDPALLEDADALAGRAVDRAESAGGFALARPGEPPGLRPSLFRGISGVGYALLRLARPGTLPCILRLE